MKYNLTQEQWLQFWGASKGEWAYRGCGSLPNRMSLEYENRIALFKQKYPYIHYDEDMFPTSRDYYGYLEGDEKHITMFLLQL